MRFRLHSSGMNQRTKTPCLGMCSTTYGDQVCRGCRRFAHETRDWNRYEDREKLAVLARLEKLQVEVLSHAFVVADPDRLWAACSALKVRGARPDFDPLCWAAELIRMGGSALGRLEDFGVQLMPAFEHMDTGALSDWVVQSLYARAEAEYDRLHNIPLTFE